MSNDNQLQTSVIAELNWEPSIKAAHIGVAANDGVVTLSGHVETYMEKSAANNVVCRVKGVKAVAEEIDVRLPFDVKRTDEDIAAAALNRLEWDGEVANDVIRIQVEKGWVTLTGEVEWHFQMHAGERDVHALGVGVSNQITLRPRVNTHDISESIRHALHRSWFDPKTNNVPATDGNVHLTGTALSWFDRELAGSTTWAAPGATGVRNDIRIM